MPRVDPRDARHVAYLGLVYAAGRMDPVASGDALDWVPRVVARSRLLSRLGGEPHRPLNPDIGHALTDEDSELLREIAAEQVEWCEHVGREYEGDSGAPVRAIREAYMQDVGTARRVLQRLPLPPDEPLASDGPSEPAPAPRAADPEWLTAAEAAAEMRCHLDTIRRMIRRGELPARLVAGRYLIDPASLPTRAPLVDTAGVAPARVLPRGDGIAAQAARRVAARLDAEHKRAGR